MTFEPIRDDIVDHLEEYCETEGADDCEHVTSMMGNKSQPKSSRIARILKANIQPPSTSVVIFSPSKYTGPSENRLDYIESDEEDASDSEVVESSQSCEDDTSSSEDIDDDESDAVTLVPVSHSDESDLARMVRVYSVIRKQYTTFII